MKLKKFVNLIVEDILPFEERRLKQSKLLNCDINIINNPLKFFDDQNKLGLMEMLTYNLGTDIKDFLCQCEHRLSSEVPLIQLGTGVSGTGVTKLAYSFG